MNSNGICRYIAFLILVSFSFCSLSCQNNCYEAGELISSGKKIYMIGEAHLDNPIRVKTKEELILAQHQLSAEAEIKQFLVDSGKVNHFILEAPIYVEYFYRKFIESGDTSWLDEIKSQDYQMGKVLQIRKFYTTNRNIEMHCIDLDFNYSCYGVVNSLFWISFYECFPALHQNKLDKSKGHYDNIIFPRELTDTATNITPSISGFLHFIWDVRVNRLKMTDKNLLAEIKKVFTSPAALRDLKIFYGAHFDLLYRLMRSYVYSFNLIIETSEADLAFREAMLYANFMELYKRDTADNYCLQLGAFHMMNDTLFETISLKIENKLKLKTEKVFMVAQGYESHFPSLQPIDFDFRGSACFRKNPNGDTICLVR